MYLASLAGATFSGQGILTHDVNEPLGSRCTAVKPSNQATVNKVAMQLVGCQVHDLQSYGIRAGTLPSD
ncbi:hypothetical protein G112A_00470 [Candidatus Nanosynsacchari sp. TM7_G1_3_12Alb]|nr:hypothetical protein G112A_00470 [Candidatus Nanosynsacchari sp. TM7_G1_3_12Alb]